MYVCQHPPSVALAINITNRCLMSAASHMLGAYGPLFQVAK